MNLTTALFLHMFSLPFNVKELLFLPLAASGGSCFSLETAGQQIICTQCDWWPSDQIAQGDRELSLLQTHNTRRGTVRWHAYHKAPARCLTCSLFLRNSDAFFKSYVAYSLYSLYLGSSLWSRNLVFLTKYQCLSGSLVRATYQDVSNSKSKHITAFYDVGLSANISKK